MAVTIPGAAQRLTTAAGDVHLLRWPPVSADHLQAWDAADEYLLTHVESLPVLDAARPSAARPNTLLVNDTFGALATCLHHLSPVSWSDSSISHRAAAENLKRNGIVSPLRAMASTDTPGGSFDLVLIRIPKSTALLEDQLARLKPHVHAGTRIIAAAMIKHLQKSAFACFERYLGTVTTSQAIKKARLLFVQVDDTLPDRASPYPCSFTDAELGITLTSHANVFSRDHLDHGARFLVNQYDQLPHAESVVDLGCGHGVLGIMLQQAQPTATIQFIDESYSAVASAEASYHDVFPDATTHAEFTVANALDCRSDASVDLVLCNPPFHQQHTRGDHVARSMFADSKRCLVRGGELWVVANRHLDYRVKLQRLFGNCRPVASNRKFIVYSVVKRG